MYSEGSDSMDGVPDSVQAAEPMGLRRLPSPRELMADAMADDRARQTVARGRRLAQAAVAGTGARRVLLLRLPLPALLEQAEQLSAWLSREDGWSVLAQPLAAAAAGRGRQALLEQRRTYLQCLAAGVPLAHVLIQPNEMAYLSDLVSAVLLPPTVIESQIHRELASALPCPVLLEPGDADKLQIARDARQSVAASHRFPMLLNEGRVGLVESAGNPDGAVLLGPGMAAGDAPHFLAFDDAPESADGWASACGGLTLTASSVAAAQRRFQRWRASELLAAD
ncbi:hypothetical protein JD974_07295 [Chromobacterium haemolyticum]|uniref:3-deoxy-D-arabino-heptulosonate 7-phosphate synthase n=1 Tax=Chromobacterium haemolyticum TaxID=394935 RepID=A0ABS3GKK6_9NEIS|nr:hypothetical protein [Chromobacterium haemolyticum]MBK0414211.1 hypothetical protein [Chromobacterium haemolyticum]MBO0415590.1 hypothetical protein [Chromobacterium haemolyticum]MBO0498894.1 hypothetical protein [Chromobacterium haemolyticum]OQS38400.1 hypothetical protein B0T40_05555 [Chromobacterium haemolyticum]QOD80672.1 hypothetical protein IEZ30_11830 [Chromobacterium haemolyticum]